MTLNLKEMDLLGKWNFEYWIGKIHIHGID